VASRGVSWTDPTLWGNRATLSFNAELAFCEMTGSVCPGFHRQTLKQCPCCKEFSEVCSVICKIRYFWSFLGLVAQRGRTKGLSWFFVIEKGTLRSGTEVNRGTQGGASEGVSRFTKVDWLGLGSGGASPAELGANWGLHGTLRGTPGLAATPSESSSWSSCW
jgi:hypothetical protein